MQFLIAISYVGMGACIGVGALSAVTMMKSIPTVRCPDCGVRVPVDVICLPNRCHSRCPLNQEDAVDEAQTQAVEAPALTLVGGDGDKTHPHLGNGAPVQAHAKCGAAESLLARALAGNAGIS